MASEAKKAALAQKLFEGVQDMNKLRAAGHTIRELIPTHFRIDESVDLFPQSRKFHHLRTNERGTYTSALGLFELRKWTNAVERRLNPMREHHITIPVPEKQLYYVLEAALGWCRYWCSVSAGDTAPVSYRIVEHESSRQGRQPVDVFVNAETIRVGLQRLGNEAAIENGMASATRLLACGLGDYDGPSADAILQMGIFGEVIYG